VTAPAGLVMKRLGVLGTLVWDRIWHPAGESGRPVEQWGGIAYSLSAFSAACPHGWSVVPILRVGSDLAGEALGFLRSLPNLLVAEAALRVVPQPNNRVELRYGDEAERTERLTGGVSSWAWAELEPALGGLSALYVNFVSGLEMDLATAAAVRRHADLPTYADLHSLYLGPPRAGPRRPRRLPRWRRWFGCFDAVQLNRAELALTGPRRAEPMSLLPEIPACGPRLALVTMGGHGAAYARLSGSEWPVQGPSGSRSGGGPAVEVRYAPQPEERLPGDPTGCGDVWGSVLFAGLLEGYPLDLAIGRAHAAAAAKIRQPEIRELPEALRAALRRHSARS
jgi:sugar/nucleoside kinase (ribokinase family)